MREGIRGMRAVGGMPGGMVCKWRLVQGLQGAHRVCKGGSEGYCRHEKGIWGYNGGSNVLWMAKGGVVLGGRWRQGLIKYIQCKSLRPEHWRIANI